MRHIQTVEDLREAACDLRGASRLAVDTEAAGFHRYRDAVCLVQLSTPAETYLVDTVAISDLSSLADVLEDPGTEVVLHDADYDLRLLDRDFDLRISRLFDTKVAAQLLGEPAFGLANLLEKHLGVKLEKKHQRADWGARPLSDELLAYAANDTRYLIALRERLFEDLRSRGRLHWAEEEFVLRTAVRWDTAPDPDAFLKLKHTRDLSPRQLGVLRGLHGWREMVAEERDLAPFRVMTNDALVNLARTHPVTASALAESAGMSSSLVARRGEELLQVIRDALALPVGQLPVRPVRGRRPPPDPALEALVDRLKAIRDGVAKAVGLDRGFLMARQQLEVVARAQPRTEAELTRIPEMRRWQVEVLGDRLLAAVRGS